MFIPTNIALSNRNSPSSILVIYIYSLKAAGGFVSAKSRDSITFFSFEEVGYHTISSYDEDRYLESDFIKWLIPVFDQSLINITYDDGAPAAIGLRLNLSAFDLLCMIVGFRRIVPFQSKFSSANVDDL